MDCRCTLSVVALLLAAVAGCDMKSFQLWPTPPSGVAAHASDLIPPRPEEIEESPKELKPATLVAMGGFKEQCAAETTDSPQEKENCREAARQAYLKALEKDPKYVPAHIALARWHDNAGNHQKAIATYQSALKVAPKDRSLWSCLGMCHARAKEWDAATDSLRKAVELDPDDRQCAKTLGLCLARAGRYEESLVVLDKTVGKAEAHYTVARMSHHVQQDEVSKHNVRLALQYEPDHGPARELLDELEGRAISGNAANTQGKPSALPQ